MTTRTSFCSAGLGGIVLAAFDQVPSALHDNSLIVGGLSFLVGFIMLFDLYDPMARHVADTTQTDENLTAPSIETHLSVSTSTDTNHINGNNNNNFNANENKNGTQRDYESNAVTNSPDTERTRNETQTKHRQISTSTSYLSYQDDNVDFVHTEQLPHAQKPVFEQVLMPEKRRSVVQRVPDPGTNALHSEVIQRSSSAQHSLPYYDKYKQWGGGTMMGYPMHDVNKGQPTQFRDIEDGGPPMMVIRDYSRVVPYKHEVPGGTRHHHNAMNHSDSDKNRWRVAKKQQANPIRPGFVANATRMWNRRAQETDELNTIV